MISKRMQGFAVLALAAAGCESWLVREKDRQVYQLIHDRQLAALGAASDATLSRGAPPGPNTRMYDFTPRPIGAEVPAFFTQEAPAAADAEVGRKAQPSEERNGAALPGGISDVKPADVEDDAATQISPSIFPEELQSQVRTFGLSDSIAYAIRHARDVQDAKETLYLAALDLTLERHLWTPQFAASLTSDYENLGQVNAFDQTLTTISEVAAAQRLPLGGEVTARGLNTLVRDLQEHVSNAESSAVILEAELPLFRGAGRVAYESRYQAERRLIYAVRDYEDFRRSFVVSVAGAYFDLQERKAAISNAYKSYLSRFEDWRRADFINRMGRSRTIFDASRVRASLRRAEVELVRAKESYATSLDRFKILVGMPVDELLDVVAQEEDVESREIDALLPSVDEAEAMEVALEQRLDRLTSLDQIDDADRGVRVARNQVLPDVTLSGSVSLNTPEDELTSGRFNTDRTTWRAGASVRMDDRMTERNAYRAALISLRQARRSADLLADTIRADVRRAIRRIEQQRAIVEIQSLNVEENEQRYEAAKAQEALGKISNQDVVDADTDLLAARNELAAAVSAYRNAILQFRLDTGTLRVSDEGKWAH